MRKSNKDQYGIDWFLAKHAEAYWSALRNEEGVVFDWFARDMDDNLAMFWPSDCGAMPRALFDVTLELHLQWYKYFLEIDPSMIEGDDDVDLPKFGFYYFDISHNGKWREKDCYVRVGVPKKPRLLAEIPAELQPIFKEIYFPGRFAVTEILYVRRYFLDAV